MSQNITTTEKLLIYESNPNGIIGVQFLNEIEYSKEDLKLFAETACVQIGLESLPKFLENDGYNNLRLRYLIHSISRGISVYQFVDITNTSKAFHKKLFDVMYIRTLRDLPLMINNCEWTIKPVISWRFVIGK
jgi:hypothetical protein